MLINKIICNECGKIRYPFDSWTSFGCQGTECMEPLDPLSICKECFPKVKKRWIKRFKAGYRTGNWQKSKAEIQAAKECKLAWVGSGGIGVIGSKQWADSSQYIPVKEFKRLSKMPYYGYCRVCGAKNVGGCCSDKDCEKSFYQKLLR